MLLLLGLLLGLRLFCLDFCLRHLFSSLFDLLTIFLALLLGVLNLLISLLFDLLLLLFLLLTSLPLVIPQLLLFVSSLLLCLGLPLLGLRRLGLQSGSCSVDGGLLCASGGGRLHDSVWTHRGRLRPQCLLWCELLSQLANDLGHLILGGVIGHASHVLRDMVVRSDRGFFLLGWDHIRDHRLGRLDDSRGVSIDNRVLASHDSVLAYATKVRGHDWVRRAHDWGRRAHDWVGRAHDRAASERVS